jgi:hypothetical protein
LLGHENRGSEGKSYLTNETVARSVALDAMIELPYGLVPYPLDLGRAATVGEAVPVPAARRSVMIDEPRAAPSARPVRAWPARPSARLRSSQAPPHATVAVSSSKELAYHLPAAHRTITLAAGPRGWIQLPATCGAGSGGGAIPGTPELRTISRAPRRRRSSTTAAIAMRPRPSTAPRRAKSRYAFIATRSRPTWLSSPSAFGHPACLRPGKCKISAPGQSRPARLARTLAPGRPAPAEATAGVRRRHRGTSHDMRHDLSVRRRRSTSHDMRHDLSVRRRRSTSHDMRYDLGVRPRPRGTSHDIAPRP